MRPIALVLVLLSLSACAWRPVHERREHTSVAPVCTVCAACEEVARRLKIAPVSINAPPPKLMLHNHKDIVEATLRVMRDAAPDELRKLGCVEK